MSPPLDPTSLSKARALLLVEAAELAGLTPIPLVQLHSLAYFASVLSPVWNLPPQKRTVVHQNGGPYYPDFQDAVDHLVGAGLVQVEDVEYYQDIEKRWRLSGTFYLADIVASRGITDRLRKFGDENDLSRFYVELANAYSNIPSDMRSKAFMEDAIYSRNVGEEVLIDFAEWKNANYSEQAAMRFDSIVPDEQKLSATQKLYLYAHHLRRKIEASA